jgi:hypothetical protein
VRLEGDAITVRGRGRVKLFTRDTAPRWFGSGEVLPLSLN